MTSGPMEPECGQINTDAKVLADAKREAVAFLRRVMACDKTPDSLGVHVAENLLRTEIYSY
jgi:hypothetical protein